MYIELDSALSKSRHPQSSPASLLPLRVAPGDHAHASRADRSSDLRGKNVPDVCPAVNSNREFCYCPIVFANGH